MFNKLINGGLPQVEYGVALYGVPRNDGKIILQYFLYFLFLLIIPVILIVGVLAFAKKKQFSNCGHHETPTPRQSAQRQEI